jgi:diguanylate cyclase (GGDEF)-like protein
LTSFKLKLVVYFLLLSLLPLAAAFSGFAAVTKRSETRLVDARLQAGLRGALAAYQQELSAADRHARTLAGTRDFQRALSERDARPLQRLLGGAPDLRIEAADGFRVGRAPELAAERQVAVLGPGGLLGLVIASVPLDEDLLERLRDLSGLEQGDLMVLLRAGRIVAGPPGLQGRLDVPPGAPRTVQVGGIGYRALVASTFQEQPTATLAILSPQARIDAANGAVQRRLLFGLLALLGLVGLVGYFEGRTIVRTLGQLVDAANDVARGRFSARVSVRGRDELALLGRSFNEMAAELDARVKEVEAERARLRQAFTRFGEALAATHDPDQLLRVVAETAVQATGATGGTVAGPRGELVQVGRPDLGGAQIALPLEAGGYNFGTLTLFAPEFSDEERMTATSLSAHAVVALENARLHRIVEHQALVDGLTGLANRRQCETSLSTEFARAVRFDDSLALVMADLDDFKDVNDRHGHPAGDGVLRELALVLRGALRDADIAGRWGGEEFALILPGTDAEGAVSLAERIREALRDRVILSPEGARITVTASFGVASYPYVASEAELVAAADAALYEAKRAGKDRVAAARAPSRSGHP